VFAALCALRLPHLRWRGFTVLRIRIWLFVCNLLLLLLLLLLLAWSLPPS